MQKRTLITLGAVVTGIVLVLCGLVATNNASISIGGQMAGEPKFNVAATSSRMIVGPQSSTQVVATSSYRYFLYVANSNQVAGVYCRGDNDKKAFFNEGILIASTTQNYYEWSIHSGNLYKGGLQCVATASTTILVTEYRVNQ
jgi:hypothetical protein